MTSYKVTRFLCFRCFVMATCVRTVRESLKQLKIVRETFCLLGDLNMVFAMNH